MPNLICAVACGIAALACLQPSQALASEDREGNAITPLQMPLPARVNPFGVKPLQPAALAAKRGGTDVSSEMVLKGVVADNRAINVATGNNVISEGAFNGASGLPIVIQNSGNNVLIQNATIVNVQLK